MLLAMYLCDTIEDFVEKLFLDEMFPMWYVGMRGRRPWPESRVLDSVGPRISLHFLWRT